MAMGFNPKGTIMKQQIYKLFDEYLQALSARTKTGHGHLLMGEAIIWDGEELPTPAEALATAVADMEKRHAAAAGTLKHQQCNCHF